MENPLQNPASMKEAITNSSLWENQAMNDGQKSASSTIKMLLETEQELKNRKSAEISFSPPILTRDDAAVFFPNSINTIQGQTGAHKSRLAEVICSALLKNANCTRHLLNFKRNESSPPLHVVYVDTERNLKEQFPAALQSILIGAGYAKEDNPLSFHYTSLLTLSRQKRYAGLNDYLKQLRITIEAPLFVVLDVTSDCIEDFNRVDKSMELIDMLGCSINEHNVTFLCILHENPGSEKMRGHLGTELNNKSTTVIQIAFDKDARNNDTHLLKVTFKKCRSTKRHAPFYVKYSELGKELVLADEIDLTIVENSKKEKASTDEMIDALNLFLGNQERISRRQLLDLLIEKTGASEKTIEERLKGLYETKTKITNSASNTFELAKKRNGRSTEYYLTPILEQGTDDK